MISVPSTSSAGVSFFFCLFGVTGSLGLQAGRFNALWLGAMALTIGFFLEDLPSKAKNCYREILVDIEDFEKKVPEKKFKFELLNFYIPFAVWKKFEKKVPY